MAKFDYIGEGALELLNKPIPEKIERIVDYEKQLKMRSPKIAVAISRYDEIIDEKAIVTSDGAYASSILALPEYSLSAVAKKNSKTISFRKSAGICGGWDQLFSHPSLVGVVEETAKYAIDLLNAKYPKPGIKTVILSPAIVGLLCHEAIGHTVEADFVRSGSVAKGEIGKKIASELVSIHDSGLDEIKGYGAGITPFDDEGVKAKTVKLIEKGVLNSYLHNRESAHEFGQESTGNARAWSFDSEPIIRMRNTYMCSGSSKLEQMISEIDDGYLIEGGSGGQADSNGEFMFGCSYIVEIKNGKRQRLLKEVTLSGIAFDVLSTVDAVSQEFMMDLGAGFCGKGQPAKVDAGGPYVRCKIHVGGR